MVGVSQHVPSSPTLTNPDLILPVQQFSSSPSYSQPLSTFFDHDLGNLSSPGYTTPTFSRNDHIGSYRSSSSGSNPSPPISVSGAFSPVASRKMRPLSDIEEVEYPSQRSSAHAQDATTPAPRATDTAAPSNTKLQPPWKQTPEDKRLSTSSSDSMRSEELENLKWPGLKRGGKGADAESSSDAEDEEGHLGSYLGFNDRSESDTGTDGDNWLGPRADETSSDSGDSLAQDSLSRQADMILANAKKRLNLMKGNLRGARSTLVSPPTTYSRPYSAMASDRDRQQPHGMLGGRGRQFSPSPLGSGPVTGHTRGMSETYAQSSSSSRPVPAPRFPVHTARSSSALSALTNTRMSSIEKSASLRGVKSQEVIRDKRRPNWATEVGRTGRLGSPLQQAASEQDLKVRARSETPPHHDNMFVEVTPDGQVVRRPSAASGNLQAQMNELKGRISSLKEKAREEQVKRQSLNSLRTPSPFTAAEIWYQGADAYKAPPLTPNGAGVGWSASQSPESQRPVSGIQAASEHRKLNEGQPDGTQSSSSLPYEHHHEIDSQESSSQSSPYPHTTSHRQAEELRKNAFSHAESRYEDAEEELDEDDVLDSYASEPMIGKRTSSIMEKHVSSASTLKVRELLEQHNDSRRESEVHADNDARTVSNDDFDDAEEELQAPQGEDDDNERADDSESIGGQSEYFETSPVAERHEDRADAFDYENFFLHSAMGSFTRMAMENRRDSMGSQDSIETTKPLSPFMEEDGAMSENGQFPTSMLHQRSRSIDSISTLATFRTATEGNTEHPPTPGIPSEYEEDDNNEDEDEEGEQLLDTITEQVISTHHPRTGGTLSAADSFISLPSPKRTVHPRRSNSLNHQATYQKQQKQNLAVRAANGASPVANIVNILLDHTSLADATGFLDSDRELLDTVVSSMQNVCLSLQHQPTNAYDRRVWRRRMDAARRVLDGEYDPTIS